jgi:hypothetical protein
MYPPATSGRLFTAATPASGKIGIDDYVKIDSGVGVVQVGSTATTSGKIKGIDDYITLIDGNINEAGAVPLEAASVSDPSGITASTNPR